MRRRSRLDLKKDSAGAARAGHGIRIATSSLPRLSIQESFTKPVDIDENPSTIHDVLNTFLEPPVTAPFQPTDAELAILRVLWEREPRTVREVHAALTAGGKEVAYTTVLKMLQIMTEKRLVLRDDRDRAHRYRTATPRPKAQKQLVDDFVERAFGGAAAELVLHALAGRKASPQELDEIRRLLDRMESKFA